MDAFKSWVVSISWAHGRNEWLITLTKELTNQVVVASLEVLLRAVKKCWPGTSLVAQWLRIRLPMQGTWVRALVPEDPTCRGAAKPMHHNYWACALEPVSHNYWACVLQPLKPTWPRACAPQQEKLPQWEARAPQQRVAPARRNWRKPMHSNEDPTQPKINI